MRRWADFIKVSKDDLAAICILELGKPFTETLEMVKYGTDFIDWFKGPIERQYSEAIPAAKGENKNFKIRQPQGVVAAITPWYSPIAMVTRKVSAAIASGYIVVCKPAPETPLCAIAIAKLCEKAGGPPGVLNIVTSTRQKSPQIGEEFTTNPLVLHLSFTASMATGRFLHAECAKTFKKTSMELGGNAPFIIFEGTKLDKAAEGFISSKFRSSSQTCLCDNRVFGPLYSFKAFDKIHPQIDDALAKGGKIYSPGKDDKDKSLGPNFYPPTITTNATTEMIFVKQETFGLLALLTPFDTDEEVIALANSTNAELTS